MKLTHFETPEAVRSFVTDTILWDLREELSLMTGSEAEFYSDEDCAAMEDKIADIKAWSNQQTAG